MKKQYLRCPICGRIFNPLIPYKHIKEFHPNAVDSELILIRDARRSCFGKDKPQKQRSTLLSDHLPGSPSKPAVKVTAR